MTEPMGRQVNVPFCEISVSPRLNSSFCRPKRATKKMWVAKIAKPLGTSAKIWGGDHHWLGREGGMIGGRRPPAEGRGG